MNRFSRFFPLGLTSLLMLWFQRGYFHRPFWGDEVVYVEPTIFTLKSKYLWPWIYNPPMGHPPLHAYFVRLCSLFTDDVLFAPIALSFVSTLLCLLFIQLFAEKIGGRRAAWIGVLTFAALPAVYSFSTAALCDFPSLAAGLAGLWYAQERKWGRSCLFLCLAILLRESSLAFVAAIPLFAIGKPKAERPRAWVWVLPAGLLALHIGTTMIRTGHWSIHPYALGQLAHTDAAFFTLNEKWESLVRAVGYISYTMRGYGIVISVAALPLFMKISWERDQRILPALSAATFFFVGFFVWYADHNPQDFMVFYFLSILVTGLVCERLLERFPSKKVNAAILIIGFAILASRLSALENEGTVSGLDLHRINLVQDEIKKIEDCCRGKKIYAEYPFRNFMSEPHYRYVKTAIPLVEKPEDAEIVVTSSFMPTELQGKGTKLWTDRNPNGDWVSVRSMEPEKAN